MKQEHLEKIQEVLPKINEISKEIIKAKYNYTPTNNLSPLEQMFLECPITLSSTPSSLQAAIQRAFCKNSELFDNSELIRELNSLISKKSYTINGFKVLTILNGCNYNNFAYDWRRILSLIHINALERKINE